MGTPNTSKFFHQARPDDSAKALGCSFALYAVPLGIVPLGVVLLTGLYEDVGDYWWIYPGALFAQGLAWGAWLIFWRSRRWLRLCLTGPLAVLLTLAPLYLQWHFGPPSVEEITTQRPPEVGNWEPLCSLEGFRISENNSQAALLAEQLWLIRDSSYYLWQPGDCAPVHAAWVPTDSLLLDGGLDGLALYAKAGELFVADATRRWVLNRDRTNPLRGDGAKLSFDGTVAAWVTDTDSKVIESPWQLTVQELSQKQARVIPLDLPYTDPHPVRLLAYRPDSSEAVLELHHNRYAVVDRHGQIIFGPILPDDCDTDITGSFATHPRGWYFYGAHGPDCEFRWQWETDQSRYQKSNHIGELSSMHTGVASAAISANGQLGAVVTYINVGHLANRYESVFVFGTTNGTELFRRHLALDMTPFVRDHVVKFLGNRFVVYSDQASTDIYRIGEW